jgi:hypothetical protein
MSYNPSSPASYIASPSAFPITHFSEDGYCRLLQYSTELPLGFPQFSTIHPLLTTNQSHKIQGKIDETHPLSLKDNNPFTRKSLKQRKELSDNFNRFIAFLRDK